MKKENILSSSEINKNQRIRLNGQALEGTSKQEIGTSPGKSQVSLHGIFKVLL